MCQNRSRLLIFQSTKSLSRKKFLFRKVVMTSLRLICGLPPPPKSRLRLCVSKCTTLLKLNYLGETQNSFFFKRGTIIHLGGLTQYPFFVRIFFAFLLYEKVWAFSSAFLYFHIRTNQTVTYWKKVFRKKFFVKDTALF